MKITAELVRVRQDWDPNTNEHHNSVTFAFAGVEVEVPVTPAQVKAIIVESQRQTRPMRARDSAGELTGRDPHTLPVQPMGVGEDDEIDPDAGGEGLDGALADELAEQGADAEFGGDFEPDPNEPVRRAPALFQGEGSETPQPAPSLDAALAEDQAPAPPPTPTQQRKAAIAAGHAQDPAAQRATSKTAMRARAAAVPMRRVAKDEAGNPIPEPRSAQIAGPAGHPEVVVRRQAPQITGGDDDGFGQG